MRPANVNGPTIHRGEPEGHAAPHSLLLDIQLTDVSNAAAAAADGVAAVTDYHSYTLMSFNIKSAS